MWLRRGKKPYIRQGGWRGKDPSPHHSSLPQLTSSPLLSLLISISMSPSTSTTDAESMEDIQTTPTTSSNSSKRKTSTKTPGSSKVSKLKVGEDVSGAKKDMLKEAVVVSVLMLTL